MLVSIFDVDQHDVAGLQSRVNIPQIDMAVNLRRIGLRSSRGANAAIFIHIADFVDDYRNIASDLCRKLGSADRGSFCHDTLEALFLDCVGHGVGQMVRLRAVHRFKAERPYPV